MRMRMLVALAFVCGATVYCAEGTDGESATDDDGGSTGAGASGAGTGTGGQGAGEVICNGVGFASDPTMWTLPDYGVDINGDPLFERTGDSHTCPDSGVLRYQVVNLDGDSKVDLVITENCAADLDTGASVWRVHQNIDTGFNPEPVLWTLPSYGVDINGEPLFQNLADSHTCPDSGVLRYQLLDLTGDGRTDLVVTENCTADTQTGSVQWRVHENTGTGFAPEPLLWTLPAYGVDINGDPLFEQVADVHTCPDSERLRFQVLDLNGDARPDLVVSENCAADTATGAQQWLVHENTGSGFAPEAVAWSLPDYGVDVNGDPMFEEIANVNSCPDGGRLRYQLLDLSGDDKADLVVSDNCLADLATGAQQWLVHENTGNGFAPEAVVWSLPAYGVDINGESLFESISDVRTCPDNGRLSYVVLDLAGDNRPDLVVSDNCEADTTTGATTWRVHKNSGGGFEGEPVLWPIPDYGLDINGEPLYRDIAGTPTCPDSGVLRFQLLELSGDSKTDFLVSDNCEADVATGASQWRLHTTECE